MNQKVTLFGYKAASKIAPKMPLKLENALCRLVGTWLSKRAGSRALVLAHQKRLSPMLTEPELSKRVQLAYETYAKYWASFFRIGSLSPDAIESQITVTGREHIQTIYDNGKGVILAMPHIGCWDLGGAWVGLHWPITVVAEKLEPPELFEFFCDQRSANKMSVVGLDKDCAKKLLSVLGRGEIVGILCDRDLEHSGVQMDFFGEPTTMALGPAVLSLRSGAPIAGAVVYQDGDRYRGVITPPIIFERKGKFKDDVLELTRLVALQLEMLISQAPEQWHVLQPFWTSDFEERNKLTPPAERAS